MSHRMKILQQTEPEVTEEELSESELQQEEPEVPELEVTTESLLLDQINATKDLMSSQSDICEHMKEMYTALSDIRKINLAILKEQRDGADEGGRMQIHGKVGHKAFFVIDTQKDPGHKVKSFIARNDGPKDIYIAYNAAISSIGPSIEDVRKSVIFEKIEKDEKIRYNFNRNVIKNIYILAHEDESRFRIDLSW